MKTPEEVKKGPEWIRIVINARPFVVRKSLEKEEIVKLLASQVVQADEELESVKREKQAMQRRIDTLDQHATRLHAALTEQEREIARLTAELETVKRERDAAVKDLEASKSCGSCIHFSEKSFLLQDADLPSQCVNCILDRSQYVWRGVQENGGTEE